MSQMAKTIQIDEECFRDPSIDTVRRQRERTKVLELPHCQTIREKTNRLTESIILVG